ncbi:phosphoinositide phosphatase family protein [Striga asiatica]|uniref:Phosphoinositide phosphatase family protein n=1 Tax=Striga asiatica TaxID=4170 RepID=A0A5A7PQY6_STRAF|nr:phosphoinositide phosphatase family protein [Striga asiatica]
MMEKADPAHKLFNRMRLWEFPDQYVVEPTDGSSAPFLVISRVDGSMNLTEDITDYVKFHVPRTWTIYGVVGTVKLIAGMFYCSVFKSKYVVLVSGGGVMVACQVKCWYNEFSSYLLVITERECVGSYMGYPIFKITSLMIFPCDHSLNNAPEEQKKVEIKFCELLRIAERTPGLYFSYDVNITLSTQRLHDLGEESKLLPLWKQSVLNLKLCEGTRMWRRGADSDGFVANFVETEQIIQVNGHTASFVQVRGSIPLLWDQIVDITYKPKFNIIEVAEVSQVVERHFCDLRKKYGNVQIVNLVNKHGGEGHLCGKFGSALQSLARDDLRYLLLNDKGEKNERQVGVSMIACKMLESQLRRLGVFKADETIRRHPKLDESFKNLWANHGDDISIQYTGTPALKGDFVRIGQRTVLGMLKDGWSSLLRYYLNNFCDGTKQDAIDLLQGHYIVSVSQSMLSTKKEDGIEAIASIQLALLLITVGFFFAAISLRRAQRDPWNLLFSIMWTCVSLAIASLVKSKGRAFCNRPRLHPPRK